ncbi:cobalamin binding intrinsic factor [Xenopus tropicalis]|uniref:Cobalamin binding intrinsic factor n=1 Tax=Xenopus tropicalis TaxID=8364 RepID=A0A803JXJ1_XENTR|nr:cobalamin binding intrinsic factor [Xenopus tropicalis]
MQWLVFCAKILICISIAYANIQCSVSDKETALVTALLVNLERTVEANSPPDPSVLLALTLGSSIDTDAKILLTQQLKEDLAMKVSQDLPFSSGRLALYTLALRSSCCDPTKIPTAKGDINLVYMLEEKTQEEIASIENTQSPLTTLYQVALDVLALCVMSSPEAFQAAYTLSKVIPPNPSGHSFSVDTAAIGVMGFTCVLAMDGVPPQMLKAMKMAHSTLLTLILSELKSDGVIGNIYTTGLAGQALTSAQSYYTPEYWNCPCTLQQVLQQIPLGTFAQPGPASQVLPFLNGKNYVNVKDIQCSYNANPITVEYTIVNNLVGDNFKSFIQISVNEGSTLLQVMAKAAEDNPKEFSFKTEETSFGPFVTTINHLSGSNNDKTFWQFFSGSTPLNEGVGVYKPSNKEHILAIFSKY